MQGELLKNLSGVCYTLYRDPKTRKATIKGRISIDVGRLLDENGQLLALDPTKTLVFNEGLTSNPDISIFKSNFEIELSGLIEIKSFFFNGSFLRRFHKDNFQIYDLNEGIWKTHNRLYMNLGFFAPLRIDHRKSGDTAASFY